MRPRVLPIVVGLAPGVIVGTLIVSQVHPGWLKFGTFAVLLPLILLQAAGFRRPIRAERTVGMAVGGGVGLLYAVTTISGPPLAVALNNQGFAKREFRAAMGFIRPAESAFTAAAYAYAGLYTAESFGLIPLIVPSLLLGVPLGTWIIRRIDQETFRRVCMSFDAWVRRVRNFLSHARVARRGERGGLWAVARRDRCGCGVALPVFRPPSNASGRRPHSFDKLKPAFHGA